MLTIVSQVLGEGCCSQGSRNKVHFFNDFSANEETRIQTAYTFLIMTQKLLCPIAFWVSSGWCGQLQQRPEPAQGCPTGTVRRVKGLTSEPEHPSSMRCTVWKSKTLFLVVLSVMGRKGWERVLSPAILHLFPCVLSTRSHLKVKGRGVLAAEESSLNAKGRSAMFKSKHSTHAVIFLAVRLILSK